MNACCRAGRVLGSIIGRVITGDAPFLAGLAAAYALVAIHWLFAALAYRWPAFAVLVKGHPRRLVRDGIVDWDEMRRTHMTEADLWEDLRENGVSDIGDVKEAHLERSGNVSVVRTA